MGDGASALDEILTLYDEGSWEECLSACKEELGTGDEASIDDWYMVRSVLAGVVIQIESTPGYLQAELVAVAGLEQVVNSERIVGSDERRGLAFRTLGYFYGRRTEERPENNNRSVECYEHAVEILRSHEMRQEWAEATVCLGNQLLERSRIVTVDEIAANAEEIALVKKSVQSAISAYERALSIYTEAQYPDERETTVDQIAGAHRILDILNRHERMLH